MIYYSLHYLLTLPKFITTHMPHIIYLSPEFIIALHGTSSIISFFRNNFGFLPVSLHCFLGLLRSELIANNRESFGDPLAKLLFNVNCLTVLPVSYALVGVWCNVPFRFYLLAPIFFFLYFSPCISQFTHSKLLVYGVSYLHL